MLKLRRRLDLSQKPLSTKRGGEVRMQYLDRYVAIMLEIVSEIDSGHAADPDLAGDSVSTLESSRKTWQDVAHMTPSYGISVHPETKIFCLQWMARAMRHPFPVKPSYASTSFQSFRHRCGHRRSCMLES